MTIVIAGSLPLYYFGYRMQLLITIHQNHYFLSDSRLLSCYPRMLDSGKTHLFYHLQTSRVVEKKINLPFCPLFNYLGDTQCIR